MLGPGNAIQRRTRRAECGPSAALSFSSFLFSEPVQVNLSGFVDDLATKSVAATPQDALLSKQRSDAIVHCEMQGIGIKLSSDKEVNVVEGPRRREVQWIRSHLPSCVDDARYFGDASCG